MSILINKAQNSKIYDSAEVLLPEVEAFINVDMTIDSFLKNDLPTYFYIEVFRNKKDLYDFVYNFEVDFGSASVTVRNAGSPSEFIKYNAVVKRCIDNKNSLPA